MGGAVVSIVTLQQADSGFEPAGPLGPFNVRVLPLPVWISSGHSDFLPTVQRDAV